MIGVAVVGLGIGRQHLEALAALPSMYRVQALCDTDPARLQEEAERWGVTDLFECFDEMLRAPGVDLVVLCTPPHLHRAQILQALAAGRHVVCEKPLVESLAAHDEVAAAAAQAGRALLPIFQSRFGLGLQQLMHLRARGLARRALLASVETHWRREADYYATAWRGTWAAERGGVCLTQAIHAHDMLTHALGPVHSVVAHLATRVNDIEVEDCAAISLRMACGALATLSATLGAARNASRLKFVFDDLTVTSDSANPYRPAQAPWHFEGKTPALQGAIDAALRTLVPAPESFLGQYGAVHATLVRDETPKVTLAEARAALELVTAIYHAAEVERTVVLPLGVDHPKHADWTPAAHAVPKAHR